MRSFITSALTVLLAITFASCGTRTTEYGITNEKRDSIKAAIDTLIKRHMIDSEMEFYPATPDSERFWFNDAQEKHEVIMRAIVEGNATKLGSVTEFPIYQGYPLKDINNAFELKEFFNILFDDSIKNVLRRATLDDWSPMGWRGCMLLNGEYLWTTEEGLLHFVTYESQAIKQYRQEMRMQELQELDEDGNWFTRSCFLAQDSSVFLRLETMDGVERLHVFTHDEKPYLQHLVFNGTVEVEGSCHNEAYYYACGDSIITVWITSPLCIDKQDIKVIANHLAFFPNQYNLPKALKGKTFPIQRSYWRDVKKWWNK